MKRRVNAKWLFAGAGFILWGSAVFLITSTLAWFSNNVIAVDEDISGSTKGAYFAGGQGTENDPYQIASPVHLYNLAWLQDIGYFNKDSNGVYPYNENVVKKMYPDFEIKHNFLLDSTEFFRRLRADDRYQELYELLK